MRQKKLILIAEDDADDRLMIQEAFQESSLNAEVVFFTNGEELFQYITMRKNQILPSLIMLDLNMPRMNGRDVLSNIKSLSYLNAIPVVILTTSKALEERKSIIRLGGSGFYTKPSSFQELVNLIKDILNTWVNHDFIIREGKL